VNSTRSLDYMRSVTVHSRPERVYDAIATLEGLRGWWTPMASGSAKPGGTIRLEFEGMDEHIDMRVDAATRPARVVWTILEHTSLEEWAETKVSFSLEPSAEGECVLSFRHEGLSPKLACYEDCEAGWEHFLGSLVSLAERGKGSPFRGRKRRS
jgi:uncharacterized protein YndB with AHSA1/START domain